MSEERWSSGGFVTIILTVCALVMTLHACVTGVNAQEFHADTGSVTLTTDGGDEVLTGCPVTPGRELEADECSFVLTLSKIEPAPKTVFVLVITSAGSEVRSVPWKKGVLELGGELAGARWVRWFASPTPVFPRQPMLECWIDPFTDEERRCSRGRMVE